MDFKSAGGRSSAVVTNGLEFDRLESDWNLTRRAVRGKNGG
jgi:hypothetical protein